MWKSISFTQTESQHFANREHDSEQSETVSVKKIKYRIYVSLELQNMMDQIDNLKMDLALLPENEI